MLNVTSISKRSIFKVWFYRQPPWHCTNVDMWILVVLLLVLIFLPSVIMSNSRTDYFELFFAFKSTYLNTTAAVAATIESFELSKIVFQSGDLFVGFFFLSYHSTIRLQQMLLYRFWLFYLRFDDDNDCSLLSVGTINQSVKCPIDIFIRLDLFLFKRSNSSAWVLRK